MTLNEITSTIRNKVHDGLDGALANNAMSLEQLEEEVDLAYAFFVNKYIMNGAKLNKKYLMQSLNTVKLECRDLSGGDLNCGNHLLSGDQVPSIKIPMIMSTPDDSGIEFVGLVNKQEDFKVYYNISDIENHFYRVRTAHRPFIWVDLTTDSQGLITLYLFNFGKHNPLKYLSVRAMFEHPARVTALNPTYGDLEYPAPLHMQKAIVDQLVNEYINSYRKLNVSTPPNTQSDPIT